MCEAQFYGRSHYADGGEETEKDPAVRACEAMADGEEDRQEIGRDEDYDRDNGDNVRVTQHLTGDGTRKERAKGE